MVYDGSMNQAKEKMSQQDMFPLKSEAPAPKPQGGEEEVPEALKRWMARRDRLASIPVADTMEALGARRDRRDKNKWKIDGVGNFPVKGQKWLNGNAHFPGYGSVNLVMHVLDLKPTPAMNWLAEQFPHVLDKNWVAPEAEEEEESGFAPPDRSDKALGAIKDYLVGSRGLPADLVEAEMKAGRIYATDFRSKDDETGKWSSDLRAVFIGPSSAELRSIDPEGFKGCCPGSDSERSGYQVMFRGQSDGHIAIVEAAIDALSYNAIYPQRYCYSTNGSGRFNLQYRLTLEAHRNGFTTDLALDADLPGDQAAQMLFNALYVRDYIAEKLQVQPEQVDEWMLTKRINFPTMESPHQLFFSLPPQQDGKWSFSERIANPDKDAPPAERTILVQRDELKEPVISFHLARTTLGMKSGRHELVVDPSVVQQICQRYNINRARPTLGKDWNDVWKKMEIRRQHERRDQEKQDHASQQDDEPIPAPTGRFVRKMR